MVSSKSISMKKEDLLDIKSFANQVSEAARAKPLPAFILSGNKGKNTGAGSGGNSAEAEKKFKRNLEVLKSEIEDKNREIDGLKAEVKDALDRSRRLERDKESLQTRLVDGQSKPPKETQVEAMNFSQAQELAKVKDQLWAQQQENTNLRKTIDVNLRAEISKLSTEKDKLLEKVEDLTNDKTRLQGRFDRLVGQPTDNIDKREALELSRQLQVGELTKQRDEAEQEKQELREALFKAEEKLLDLKFEKETFDLQYARLQKRIQELERQNLTSAQLSAKLKDEVQEDVKEIETTVGQGNTDKKKKKDTVRIKDKAKSTAELEMLVESLKRVIDKLKTENEALKKVSEKFAGAKDKAAQEKALRQKINNLEQHIHSLEMRDINLEEKDVMVKKLVTANKQLREDLTREVDRNLMLEEKYKEVKMMFENVAKSNKKNEELVFGMSTGANMTRYTDFMTEGSSPTKKY